mgnify:CR=1 FL=1
MRAAYRTVVVEIESPTGGVLIAMIRAFLGIEVNFDMSRKLPRPRQVHFHAREGAGNRHGTVRKFLGFII